MKQSFSSLAWLVFAGLALGGCGGTFIGNETTTASTTTTTVEGADEPAARVIFRGANFTDLDDFFSGPVTTHTCLGDLLRVYYVTGDDYMSLQGGPTAFPTPSIADDLYPTNRPAFIRNVSVDITNTYYPESQSGLLASDSCSARANIAAPLPSSCADFDRTPAAAPVPTIAPTPTPAVLPTPAAIPATTQWFDSNFYRVRDDWCTSQGPTVSPDPEVTKAGVGGVSIDIDRSQLGAYEDLLMVVTYHSLNENSTADSWPAKSIAGGTAQTEQDHTILKVSLVGTGQTLDDLIGIQQPRPWTYSNTTLYPIYLKEIATLEDPFGSLRTEQVYIPLSQNALIDRIRIDRIRGSYHLYQIDLYRLGNRSE